MPDIVPVKPVLIVAARRTPQGRFGGALAGQTAVNLAVAAGRAVLEGVDVGCVDSVIVGNVLGAGLGMNVARQVGMGCRIPASAPAFTVNMMCASGMQSVILAAQAIQCGQSRMVLCGGTESMSNAPQLLARGADHGAQQVDSILRDGLHDAFSGEHMALTAERLATRYAIRREDQDRFALRSQQRCAAAMAAGRYRAELVPVAGLETDEHPRPGVTLEKLSALAPAFAAEGTVTAGNASGINDGAAMLLLCDEARARECGLTPLALITATAQAGCDPAWMGLGPVHATRKLSREGNPWDVIELNEAFAAQAIACIRELGLDEARVNPDGGAIALGHPLGASGARLLVHLAHRQPRCGLATLCVGGGMGCAVVVERP